MAVISTHQAKTHLSRYLAEVESGQEFVIAKGRRAVARLVPLERPAHPSRPKVGETLGGRFAIPEAAIAALSDEELRREWGL